MPSKLVKIAVEIINANSFCSLSRDSECVSELAEELERQGLVKRTDKPYIGCVEASPDPEGDKP